MNEFDRLEKELNITDDHLKDELRKLDPLTVVKRLEAIKSIQKDFSDLAENT